MDVVEDTAFVLRASAAGPYRAGVQSTFGVMLTPRGGYHVNREYPLEMTVTAPPGVSMPKATLTRGDAAELLDERARFDVSFTPAAAGVHRVEAKVSFAVCTPSKCIPDERTVALSLPVQGS